MLFEQLFQRYGYNKQSSKTPLSSSLQYNGPNKKVKAVWSFASFYLEACEVVGMAGVAGG